MNWSRDCLRSYDSFLATTYGALSNTYNNNNNSWTTLELLWIVMQSLIVYTFYAELWLHLSTFEM